MREKKGLFITIIIVICAIALAFFLKKQGQEQVKGKNLSKIEDKANSNTKSKEGKVSNELGRNTESSIEGNNKDKGVDSSLSDDFYIQDEAIFHKVMDEEKPLMLMFGTPDCIYCKQMKPMISKYSEEYKDQINIKYIDAYEYPDLAYKFPIRGVPAFLYRTKDKHGYLPSKDLKEVLTSVNGLSSFSAPNSDKHDITMSYGLMEEKTVRKIIKELVENAK